MQPDARRALFIVASTIAAIGVVLAADSTATLWTQAGLGLGVAALLGWHLLRATPDDRRVVLACVLFSTAVELFCTQVWGLYRYRFGNLPLYVPPGHGLLCLASLALARVTAVMRHRRRVLALAALVSVSWSAGGLFFARRPDVEGALFLVIFLPLLLRTTRGLEHATTFALASLVELAGTFFDTWEWAPVMPWLQVPSANPPSAAAGGYCTFTLAALGLARLAQHFFTRARSPAQTAGFSGATPLKQGPDTEAPLN